MIYNRVDSIYEWKPIDNTSLYHYFNTNTNQRLGSDWKLDGRILNTEVEIIEEEKEIEKINNVFGENGYLDLEAGVELMDKINELIDAVNEMRKEK